MSKIFRNTIAGLAFFFAGIAQIAIFIGLCIGFGALWIDVWQQPAVWNAGDNATLGAQLAAYAVTGLVIKASVVGFVFFIAGFIWLCHFWYKKIYLPVYNDIVPKKYQEMQELTMITGDPNENLDDSDQV